MKKSVDVMITSAITQQKHLGHSGCSTRSALYIFNTLRGFTKEPIREQEIMSECMKCWLCITRMVPTLSCQNPRLLEELYQKTINNKIKSMATVDYYHGDKMKSMQLLQGPTFRCAASQIFIIMSICIKGIFTSKWYMYKTRMLYQYHVNNLCIVYQAVLWLKEKIKGCHQK